LKQKEIIISDLLAYKNQAKDYFNNNNPEDLKKKVEELSKRYLRYQFYFKKLELLLVKNFLFKNKVI